MAKRGGAKPGGAPRQGGGVKIGMQRKAGGVKKGAQTLKAKLAANRGPAGNRGPKGGARPVTQKQTSRPSGRHCLLLKQETAAGASKTWNDYNSVPDAIDGFVKSYEAKLRNLNPTLKQLTYSVADLQTYVDSMYDVSLMVSAPNTRQYVPKGKDFLKQQCLQRLKSAVK